MLGADTYQRYMEKGIIEIAPLAYMRGRTLENSFIILDEAQNTTIEQMKMFLTRFGFNSKIVVTGDVTQVDLPRGKSSGLIHALKILENIEQIGIHKFDKKDIVRHALVQKIVDAYENFAKKGNMKNDGKSND
jgi:phosphate starvation-inducible PhoH-like protein